MAVVSVSSNNTRVEDADSITGWASIGGGQGAAAEASFPYQGVNLVNRKVTGTSGFYYDPTTDGGSSEDMTSSTLSTWMVKAIVTDYGGLNAVSGLRIRIGSGTSAYYQFEIAGTNAVIASLNAYPAKGGLIIVPIDPNIAGFRDSTTGSPVLTAVDYFGIEANFDSSTSKSENLGLDAIDIGVGLTLIGGDGGDADGSFEDFVSFDEGTINNRFGYATKSGSIIQLFGTLQIGSSVNAVGFTDNDSRVVFPDGLFAPGFSRVLIDLNNASTAVTIGCTITGLGDTTVSDSRPDHIVQGNAGTYNLNGNLENHRNIVFTSSCIVDGAVIGCADLEQGGGTIQDTSITTTSNSGVGTITDPDYASFSSNNLTQGNTGHAIEETRIGTYDWDGHTDSGYGGTRGTNNTSNSGATDALFYNNSGGLVTLNVLNGGQSPSVRNGVGASTEVVDVRQLTFSGLPIGAELRIYNDDGDGNDITIGTDREGVESLSSSTYVLSYPFDEAGDVIKVQIMDPLNFEEDVLTVTLPSVSQEIDIKLEIENNI